MVEAALSEAERREERKARLRQLRFSSIWVVFLLIPAFLVYVYSEAGPAWDWTAYGAIVLFGILYIASFAIVPRAGLLNEVDVWPHHGRFVTLLLVLLALAGLMVPSLQGSIIAILPFFAGYGLFLWPLRAGIWWTGGCVLLMLAILWIFNVGFDFGLIVGPLLSVGFVLIIRVILEWSAVEERTNLELAAVREREALSRDVHDILGHTLTVVSLKTQLARRTLRDDPAQAETELDEVLAHTQSALDEVRATVGRLRTPDLAAQLVSAKTALDTKDIRLICHGSANDVHIDHRAVFAWAVREAVTNVVRHSEAGECQIVFERNRLLVIDDGIGIGIERAEGNGLSGLRRRIEDAGGTLSVGPAQENQQNPALPGTKLEVRFP
ncbi:MAG: sensor histidine kinase [Gulosibacter sp.]|uniref:sensor histidine kinase n=1 Tax=Gulosibacter sp. TaxID=2817531 RepID=UPI003F910CBE